MIIWSKRSSHQADHPHTLVPIAKIHTKVPIKLLLIIEQRLLVFLITNTNSRYAGYEFTNGV